MVHSALSHCSSIISGDSRAAVMTSVAYRVRREVARHVSSNGVLGSPTPRNASDSVQVPRGRAAKVAKAVSYIPSLNPRYFQSCGAPFGEPSTETQPGAVCIL